VAERGQLMRWLIAATVSIVVTGIIGLAAVGGWFYWDRVQTRGEETARTVLPPLAAGQIPKVLGYDFQTVERSLGDAYPLLTPAFREDFKRQAYQTIIPEARKREVVSQVSVDGVGIMFANRNSGSVLVYMTQSVTDKSREPIYQGSRVRVDYQRIDGKWLINYMQPI
jgi:Mce-associated membrane protein